MAKKVNTIVVGQGLAGSLLAWNLMRRGERVLVIDKQREDSASMVAAGIINPVTGPRLVQSWRLEELLSAARSTYRSLEKELKDRFYTEIELVRLFRSEEERRVWMSKKSQSGTNRYLGSMRSAGWKPALVDDPYGSFCPGGSGHLAVPKLLNGMRKFLLAEGSILDSHFTYSDLKPSSDGVQWGDWEAERIVFCEGHQASENPFFRNLPFKSSKGEILEVEAEEGSLPRAIINRGKWILPLGGDRYRAGSTFSWNRLDTKPTVKGKSEILNALGEFIKAPLDPRDHRAGIRPTMKDLRPVMGAHSTYPQISIFNGLASKGVLNAPHFADHFASYLMKTEKLDPDVDLRRFL